MNKILNWLTYTKTKKIEVYCENEYIKNINISVKLLNKWDNKQRHTEYLLLWEKLFNIINKQTGLPRKNVSSMFFIKNQNGISVNISYFIED